MPNYHIQTSFHAGEFAPALYARVDLAKYHSAAALLENFFVDYRGGASTRPGTKYILQAYKSATAVRLIPFQASFTVNYVLEFGDFYVRFFNAGSPVLETATTGGTGCSGNTFTIGNAFVVGDWVFAEQWGGMTNVNNRYFIVATAAAGNITVTDLFGATPTFTGSYTSGGRLKRVYTLPSPYAAADLALVKFAQNVDTMILCHPSYPAYSLSIISAASWVFTPILFGAAVQPPTSVALNTTMAGGTFNYAYVVTSVDQNGEESIATAPTTLLAKTDMRSVVGTITVSWTAAAGAASYNVYKVVGSYNGAPSTGQIYGFIGNTTGVAFDDSNISPDFSSSPPVGQNPFNGTSVASATVTTRGVYTTPPGVTFTAAPAGGHTANGHTTLTVTSVAINTAGTGYFSGELFTIPAIPGFLAFIDTVDGSGAILGIKPLNYGNSSGGTWTTGAVPANPQAIFVGGLGGSSGSLDLTWGVKSVVIDDGGGGYFSVPSITFSAGAAAATANLASGGAPANPGVPGFFQQRLVLAELQNNPQKIHMSQPGGYYNFNTSNPSEADDAIDVTLVAGQLNTIKALVPMQSGLIVLSDQASWLINGGGAGTAVTPSSIVANPQSFIGASDVPPIVSNFDILYVQAKGSVIRDSSFNFYANVFTGTDISVLSSHLFYGYTISEWAWAEEPFKVVWAVRSDGTMLTCTFMKEQELIGWAHSTAAAGGLFKSIATVTEQVTQGSVNAVYTVVQRTINSQTVKYIERIAERTFTGGAADAWCVDAGLQYSGAPATSFSGGEHLAGQTVTGLADGVAITPFTMPASGAFTLATPASKVTVGLGYTCNLQTLRLDTGEPTQQSKMKKIVGVTTRVADTLGLSIGSDASNLVTMKDLVVGNVGGMSNQVVTGLVTDDAYTIIDPRWTIQGQYYIRQSNPLPATILGVIPQFTPGDTEK